MKIVIVGAGAVGTHLAELLSRENQDIILIDEDPVKTADLSTTGDFDLMTLNVAPTSISGLKEAGVPAELIRMSCGIEGTEDLIADIAQALYAI